MMFHHPNPLRGGCPNCGGEQLCPCKNCAPGNAGKVMWRWDETGEIISCGHCGHSGHVDQWMDWDISAWYYRDQSEHHASYF